MQSILDIRYENVIYSSLMSLPTINLLLTPRVKFSEHKTDYDYVYGNHDPVLHFLTHKISDYCSG